MVLAASVDIRCLGGAGTARHRWWIASRVEDVSEEEMVRRAKAVHGLS
jgi:hypothetical protein